MKQPWYYLDADNNKKEPKGLYCERCKKALKTTLAKESFISIELHPENPWFRIANPNKPVQRHLAGLIGSDCLERVKKEYGEMKDE